MTLLERFITWALDALLVVGVIAAGYLILDALASPALIAPSLGIIALVVILGPLALSLAAHNWVMRARIIRRGIKTGDDIE